MAGTSQENSFSFLPVVSRSISGVDILCKIKTLSVTSKSKTAFWWINHLTKQLKQEELQLPAKTLMLNQKLWYTTARMRSLIEVGPLH